MGIFLGGSPELEDNLIKLLQSTQEILTLLTGERLSQTKTVATCLYVSLECIKQCMKGEVNQEVISRIEKLVGEDRISKEIMTDEIEKLEKEVRKMILNKLKQEVVN